MNNEKKEKVLKIGGYILTAILFVCCCLFMYDFYKCLSGFIANKFREPLVMLPMVFSYLLPVICFLCYFYDTYIHKVGKVARWIYVGVVAVVCIVNLTGIFGSFSVYASNNRLGVYESIPSIILAFPYDAIVFHILLLFAQGFNVIENIKPMGKLATLKDSFRQEGWAQMRVGEYALLGLAAIFAFLFAGSAICALNAMENILYDARFLFMWVWLFLPAASVVALAIKPEKKQISKRKKVVFLAVAAGVNLLFNLAFLVFELVTPGFIIHMGKPMFSIAFSISFPVEPLVLVALTLTFAVLFAVKLIRLLQKRD